MGRRHAEPEAANGGESLDALHARLDELMGERVALDLELHDVRKAFEELGQPVPEELVELDTAELMAKLTEAKMAHQRALADFQNYQRRQFDNERRACDGAAADVVESMIGVLDTFDMARKMDLKTTPPEMVMQGIEMIRGEMLRVLGQRGFAVIEPAKGEQFDPNVHEAMQQVESADVEPGCIVELVRPGYRMHERIVRPAQVIVAAGAELDAGDDEGADDDADV
ncbi:MAG: nucleotide exchange factor GrpE [Phycisphaerales bacterium]|nr:nucleotide exchange factor GrpE [Phycisphaerales bacterium]